MLSKSPLEINRFWNKVNITTPESCWNFIGELSYHGYGRFRVGPHRHDMTMAHRVAYFLKYGEIKQGYSILHKCDNRACCNPNHLYQGTAKDNAFDMVSRGRHRFAAGANHPNSKLKEREVVQIRKMYVPNIVSQKRIAKLFNVSERLIYNVIHNKSWKHIR